MQIIGKRDALILRRRQSLLNQYEVAVRVGISQSKYSLIENGYANPSKEFDDIPITDADEIDEDFFGFEKGTNRFFVWKWFDEHYSKGVYSLVYNGGE